MCGPDLDLLPAIARLATVFRFFAACAVGLFAGELDDTNGEAPTPMSPQNQAQVWAVATCVNANAAINVMDIAFIGVYLRLVYKRNNAVRRLRR